MEIINNRLHLQNVRSIDVFSADTSNRRIAKFFDNGYVPKLPDASELEYGEIALNIHAGNEVLAIKNDNDEIVFIPFNTAEKLFQLGENFESFKQYSIDSLAVFSSNTIAHFDSIDELIVSLSSSTNVRFNSLENELKEFSSLTDVYFSEISTAIDNLTINTQNEFNTVNERIDKQNETISGITSQIKDISSKVVAGTNERLEQLSAYTLNEVSKNEKEHKEIKKDISSLSGSLITKAELITKLSGECAANFNSISEVIEDVIDDVDKRFDENNQDHIKIRQEIASTSGILANRLEVITELSASTDNQFKKNEEEHKQIKSEINAVSGALISHIDEIRHMSGQTDVNFSGVTELIYELSASTDSRFSGNTIEHDEIYREIEVVSGDIVSRLDIIKELSAYTDSRFSGNTIEHNEINNRIDNLSGVLITYIDNTSHISASTDTKVSGLTELIYELSASTDSRFSGNTIEHDEIYREIEAVSGSLETEFNEGLNELDDKYNKVTSGTTKLVKAINKSLGFDKEGNYNPENEDLQNKNVSDSIDYIDEKIDAHISAYTAQIQDLLKIILEDETVTANFAATINSSLGFTIHAKYSPLTDIIKGMNVTDAIDTIYKKVEDDISNLYNKVISGATEGMVTIEQLKELERILRETIISGDTALSIRIDALEALINTINNGYLEQSVTYEHLSILRAEGLLRRGILYRLTNYQATVHPKLKVFSTRKEVNTTDANANSGFDILIRATSDKVLNENCIAMSNPKNTEFENQKPESWQIKYSLQNDSSRFDWAYKDEPDDGNADGNGYGVIYYMKDGNGNEAPYDFKNILYNGKYTFGGDTDKSSSETYHSNIIKPTYENGKQCINRVIFDCDMAESNILAAGCKDITFTGTVIDNKISTAKNGSTISDKQNKLIGYSCE